MRAIPLRFTKRWLKRNRYRGRLIRGLPVAAATGLVWFHGGTRALAVLPARSIAWALVSHSSDCSEISSNSVSNCARVACTICGCAS